jgi:hypothetical protein
MSFYHYTLGGVFVLCDGVLMYFDWNLVLLAFGSCLFKWPCILYDVVNYYVSLMP